MQFPFILSPSLGCPQIISAGEKNEFISVIVAAIDDQFGKWSLIPSSSNRREDLNPICLAQGEIDEISKDSSYLPPSVEETRENISKEVFIKVLGGKARIFKIKLSIAESERSKIPKKTGGSLRPTLYDLCLEGGISKRKLHAVYLTTSKDKDLHFIHLTDLHLARRNDLIEKELSAAIGPIDRFNNFNKNMREFIKKANQLADEGKLDIVLIGGDLVDFVNHGVSDEVSEADNNWQVFIEILTGGGHEPRKGKDGNHGIKVPIFTSTGNHDWRLHPYDVANVASSFRISKDQAENFDFEYYDTMEKLETKKREVYEKIIKEGSPITKENWPRALIKRFLRYSERWQTKALAPIILTVLSNFFPSLEKFDKLDAIIFLIAAGLHQILNSLMSTSIRYTVTNAVIPIEASVQALHYYFLHINPYFNYVFSFGSNHFIVMDTGPDCFVGQYLWNNGNKKMRRLSLNDNILGGSPDSMAFYPVNEYYVYSQIIWLEKVLKAIESQNRNDAKRIFVCLHAPPINVKRSPNITNGEERLEDDVRYGTINHFLSQFFHLCLGRKERNENYSGPKVDVVFSGHAHQNIEFRIEWRQHIYIYCGRYSKNNSRANFDEKKPFVVQTAGCGPLGADSGSSDPPYFRRVHVKKDGEVLSFRVESVVAGSHMII